MNNLDDMLARLAREPVHPRLDGIETGVFACIGEAQSARAGIGMGAFAVVVAIGMGVTGAGAPPVSAQARAPLSPLGLSTPLAPSVTGSSSTTHDVCIRYLPCGHLPRHSD